MKVLIIGLGSIGLRHLGVLQSLNNKFEIYALRSSKNNSKINGVKEVYDFQEINFKPYFIIISNPTYLHEKTIEICTNFKCPLFIEKPVLSSLKNANKISNIISNLNIITYVACNMRFYPAIDYLKNNLKKLNLKINEINIYSGSYLPNWRPKADYKKSYSSFAAMGGGVHLDMIHEIDYCVWLFGEPKSINSIKNNNSTLNIESVDFSKFDLEYENFNAGITLNYFRRDSKRELEIVSKNDTLLVDLINNTIYSKIKKTYVFKSSLQISDSYKKQMLYFLDCLKENKDTFNNFNYGLNILKIALNDE